MLDEHDRSALEMNLRELMTGKIFNHDKYIRELSEAVKGCALNGGVVILGRGANYILNRPYVYRVRLVAPLDDRIKILMQTEGMSGKDAGHEIEVVDRERKNYVERYFKHDINDPAEYDMVINTTTHNMNGMAKAVMEAMKSKGWTLRRTAGLQRVRQMS
jgi:cytidylate kinase